MLSNDAKAMINYVNEILNNKKLNHETPKIAESDADFMELDHSIRTIRDIAAAASNGDVFHNIQGSGFVLDSFKMFQKTFKLSNKEVLGNIVRSKKIIVKGKKLRPHGNHELITVKKKAKTIVESEERYRFMTDNACDIIATMDLSGNFTYISPSVEKITGYSQEEVLRNYRELGYFLPGVQKEMDRRREIIKEMIQNGEHFDPVNFEQRQVRKDGENIYTDTVVSGIYDDENKFIELLTVTRDITEKVKKRREIKRISETDKLTQLYNRVKLDNALENELNLAKEKALNFSLIMIDIDEFKEINDCFGHMAGDEVLVALSSLFKTCIRSTDIIGRWGGEEFLVILPDTNEHDAIELAEKIRRQVNEILFLNHEHITVSLGVSVYNQDITVDSVIYRADQALYRAKNNGRNQVQVL
ncbi:sensor domain-containing diguanylate cyclase [Acetobacterium woodii]|uniref:Diguanylate cyclase n=1 Tax=Acetobacterium woodii (strain ATCC 29683 / DSM 1030 / JCM 2381 / KCTC 1655 / WB1) TaxID=931626 RepID=H6LJ91_ACEWD|nr:sensor domain-containing diguanylate cyclase [Acetobacterium woodii]AFA48654.1 hypothetical protein Awo_c18750 [Acetobacterium woodii DSM 1030]